MHIRGLRQQHDAEGVAVEAADRMYGARLPRFLIVIEQEIRQRAGVPGGRGVHQHAGRLVQRDEPLVLEQNAQLPCLRRIIFRCVLVHADLNAVADAHRIVGEHALAVDRVGAAEFQPFDQRRGQGKLPSQKRQELAFPLGGALQPHVPVFGRM